MAVHSVCVQAWGDSVISHEQNPAYLAWANQVLGVRFDPAMTAWISNLNEDGSPAAVAVFSFCTRNNCEMSVASDLRARWASRHFLGICYRYAFNQLKVARVTAVVEDDNEKSLRMCRKLGHVEEARLKCWFGEKDGIVMRMLRSECRWL